jgi:3-oxoacyl-[acyl-carrier protein] reductase
VTSEGVHVGPDDAGANLASYPDLAGKIAVVTSGSGGLGSAACRALGLNGVKVAVNGRDRAAIESVVGELHGAGAEAMAAAADCTDAAALGRMRDHVYQQFGPVDVLVAFAGGGRPPQSVTEISEADWRADVDRNLTSTFLTIKAFLPAMVSRGGGSIITMSSAAARQLGGAPIAYAVAKAGVIALSQQVAHEVGRRGVRVNSLAPSTVMTKRMEQVIPVDRQHEMAAMHTLGRLGVPGDVAQATLFLASDASSWITGVSLDITGGQLVT